MGFPLYFVGDGSPARAELAAAASGLGYRTEFSGKLDEWLAQPSRDGILIIADDGSPDAARLLIARLLDAAIWSPVVLTAQAPRVERVVDAIKAGVLDYLDLPLEAGSIAERLEAIVSEAGAHARKRRRAIEARRAVSRLSRREREVLELLSAGCSNKEIARNLEISPRTVEIHRGNMMIKLGAGHPADAVRLWLDSNQQPSREPVAAYWDERKIGNSRISPSCADSNDPILSLDDAV